MTTPEKDEVLHSSDEANQGAGDPSPSATSAVEGGAAEEAASPLTAEEVEAAIIEEAEAVLDGVLEESEIVAQAKAEAAEWQDKYMRLHAEWDTYRRRMNEQREAEKVRAAEKLVSGLIPVLDDFERTIEYAQNNGEVGLLGGVQAVHNKLVDVLKKDGVVVIDPAGQAFDALEAQAVATVPDDSVPDETVAQVYQKGYKLGIKVLRPAMVTVTTGGPKREAEQTEE
ncbi:MAG: nucleotide exchange factor GrpE [Eggerthellaceae bacterium]|nr:nucleotide exchange factor GrpE [Eggerthellaceae bacterium]